MPLSAPTESTVVSSVAAASAGMLDAPLSSTRGILDLGSTEEELDAP